MADTRTSSLTRLLTIGLLTSQVAAHGYVRGIVANGQYYPGYQPSYQYLASQPQVAGWSDPKNIDNGPVPDYQSPDIICHLGATPGAAYAEVPAGGKVELQWTPWPNGHLGPVISYLANCNGDCTAVDKTSLLFNKIEAIGLVTPGVPGTWAAGQLSANNSTWSLTIPSSIAPGNYVLRHEIIALQQAMTVGGAQNYPQCINLKVTGAGTNSLQSGTKGTALYTQQDPGLLIDIYQTLASYPMPGPPLLGSAVNGSGTASGLNVTTAGIFANSTVSTTTVAALLNSSTTALLSSSSVELSSTTTSLAVASSATGLAIAAFTSAIPASAATLRSSSTAASGLGFYTVSTTARSTSAAALSVKTSTSPPAIASLAVQTFTTTEVVETSTTVSFIQGQGFTTITATVTNTVTVSVAMTPSAAIASTTSHKHTTVAAASVTPAQATNAGIAEATSIVTPSVPFPILSGMAATFSTSTTKTGTAARVAYTGAIFGAGNDTLNALASGTGLVLSIRPLATGTGIAMAGAAPSVGFIGVPVDNGFRAKQRRRQALRDLWGQ